MSPPMMRKSAGGFIAWTSLNARTVFSTKRVLTSRGYMCVSEIQANLKDVCAACATSMVFTKGNQPAAAAPPTPASTDLCRKIRRLMPSERAGRSPFAASSFCISRRSLRLSFLSMCSLPPILESHSADAAEAPRRESLLLQLDRDLRDLLGLDRHRDFRFARVLLPGDQRVGTRRHFGKGEGAVLGGDGVVGIVGDEDIAPHPAVRVALEADHSLGLEGLLRLLALDRQSDVEDGALAREAVDGVHDRVLVERDEARPHRQRLHAGHELAPFVDELRVLGRLLPGLASGQLLQVNDRVLDAFVGVDGNLGLVPDLAAGFPILGGNHLPGRYPPLELDLAVDRATLGDGGHLVRGGGTSQERGESESETTPRDMFQSRHESISVEQCTVRANNADYRNEITARPGPRDRERRHLAGRTSQH